MRNISADPGTIPFGTKVMKEKIETVFEAVNFFRRRIQTPLYAGLIVRGVLYVDRYTKGLVHFFLTIKGIGVSGIRVLRVLINISNQESKHAVCGRSSNRIHLLSHLARVFRENTRNTKPEITGIAT